MIPHGERCFCNRCIQDRAREALAKRNRTKDADAYIKRRGGTLDNPPPSKVKQEKSK